MAENNSSNRNNAYNNINYKKIEIPWYNSFYYPHITVYITIYNDNIYMLGHPYYVDRKKYIPCPLDKIFINPDTKIQWYFDNRSPDELCDNEECICHKKLFEELKWVGRTLGKQINTYEDLENCLCRDYQNQMNKKHYLKDNSYPNGFYELNGDELKCEKGTYYYQLKNTSQKNLEIIKNKDLTNYYHRLN